MRNVLCETYPVQRSLRQNAVAGAAYRAGQNLVGRGMGQDGQDKRFPYANRSVIVRDAFFMLPDNTPDWVKTLQARDDNDRSLREEFWNRVEANERRKNARVGREMQLGFAYELTHDEQRALVEEFVQREFVDKGFLADVAIHNYGKPRPAVGGNEEQLAKIRQWTEAEYPFLEKDECEGMETPHVLIERHKNGEAKGYRLYQPHAHIRIAPRLFDGEDFSKSKKESWAFDKHEQCMEWRYEWPKLQNNYLEQAGHEVRVRSTSDAEDALPELPKNGTKKNRELMEVAERIDQLPAEERAKHEEAKERLEADRAFNDAFNEAIETAYRATDDTDPLEDDQRFDEQYRVVGFFRNMSRRIEHLRERVPDVANAWRERFRGMNERMRSWFGHDHFEHEDTGDQHVDQGERDHDEPEQDR